MGSAPTPVRTNEEKALFAVLEYQCLDPSGSVDFGHMTHVWNAQVVQRLGTDRIPTGNVFYKSEVELRGHKLALQRIQGNIERIQNFGGGAAAYRQHLAPMLEADISGKMSSAHSSGASTVGGRAPVDGFAYAGPHLRHSVVQVHPMPVLGMMPPPPSTSVGTVDVPP